jgi:RNA polymerase sigma-70 factor (ECF subfamily)
MDYERLAARHKDAVYRQMVRVCGNHDDAEDVLIEALISAFKARESLRDEKSFQGWLATIGRRVCGRIKKRESLLSLVSLVDGVDARTESTAEIEVGKKELKQCVQRSVDSLPPSYRQVYELCEIEELPAEEVARRLGISLPALKSRLHRARIMVRARLDEELRAA